MASAPEWIRETKMVYLSRGLSNARAGGRVASRKVVRADSTSGRYNLSSVISYSKGFEILTSLVRPPLVLWLRLSDNRELSDRAIKPLTLSADPR
jgi:hypothetical protein